MPDPKPIPGAPYRHSTQPTGAFVNLQSSEAAVLAAAAQIFSGYIISGTLNEKNEDLLLERSIDLAIRMAQRADVKIQSAEELDKK